MFQSRSSQLRMILASEAYLAVTKWGVCAGGPWWVETRDAANPSVSRTVPTTENHLERTPWTPHRCGGTQRVVPFPPLVLLFSPSPSA